ncbi:MAG: DUF433 domain-containing protein [Pseudomonadota bacterium]
MSQDQKPPRNAADLDVSSVIAAFSEEQVERITRLTKRRLRYWANTDFFRPSFVEDNPRLPNSRFYSFKDVVALRTLEALRIKNNVPLQHLRKVAERLSHLKDELWTKTTLYVVDRKVIFVNPETGTAEEVVSGQQVMKVILEDVIGDTKKDIADFKRRPKDSIGRISRTRAIARNAWVISGTRIHVGAIQRLYEDGYSNSQIIDEYPDLTEKDIEAALEHSRNRAA